MPTHEERIERLAQILEELVEIRKAYSRPVSEVAARATDAVKSLQQALLVGANKPKRKLAHKTAHDRIAWQRRLLDRMQEKRE